MSVVLSVEDVGPCRKQLKIEVPAPAVAAETERVVGEYRRRARLPGFRAGKVPANLVRSRFKKEIEQEVVERLVPRYWHQAEAEQKLDPLLPPELQDVDLSLGESMTFTAIVETRPAVALGDYKQLQLPDPPVEASDEEVDRQLEELRRRAGEWKKVARPASRGDRVVAEIVETGGEPEKTSFEVGDERVWEELSLAATGLTPGQSSTFRRRGAEGEEAKEYKVKVDTVEDLEPAALDDELAKKVSRFQTLGELRSGVQQMVRDAKRRERGRQRENALLQQLRERHPLTLPEGVVQQEMETMVREYAHQLSHQGIDVEHADIDWGALGERARPDAERVVHSRLLLDAIAEAEGVAVPEERLEALLAEIARDRKSTPLAVRRELDSSGRLAGLRRQLRRQETVRRLLGDEDAGVSSESPVHGHDHTHDRPHDHDHEHDHEHHGHSHEE
ncbi:MAG TPA: trigger factor [Thermoanaerobaculia bacterium]|jgi:trigger factor|nr:trigger factor [Thermoanaerobaculia bacterium]